MKKILFCSVLFANVALIAQAQVYTEWIQRAEVGLGPLADYLKHWEIEWNPVAHEKAHGNK
jgi:hypothetical protein